VQVPKVKKQAAVASGRNVKPNKGMPVERRSTAAAGRVAGTRGPAKKTAVARKGAAKKGSAGTARGGRTVSRREAPAPVVRVVVKALDPYRKCGPGTSVQSLYRVDETIDGRSTAHLVFNDRHGWYCEHGRTCPAVGHAKKYDGRIARAS
jgi:hypothetical protein